LVSVDSELTEPRLKQLLPDCVLACPSADAPEVIVIVEVHLAVSERKRRVWPQYAAAAFGRHACRAELVVVTPSARVERWARTPIQIGRRHVMTPTVLGPSALPLLTEREICRAPVLAMLSTLAHVDNPACPRHALRTLEALTTWGGDPDGRLADILQAALPAAVLAVMEELMRTEPYEYKSEFARKYYAKGREEGRATGRGEALLLVLQSREIEVPAAARERIETERDSAQLEDWLRRAATATSIDDVMQ
jgi:hypothetical protein